MKVISDKQQSKKMNVIFCLFVFQRPPVAFYIDNLEPGNSYRIILFAVNAKGRSEPTIIDDITFKGVAKFTGENKIDLI